VVVNKLGVALGVGLSWSVVVGGEGRGLGGLRGWVRGVERESGRVWRGDPLLEYCRASGATGPTTYQQLCGARSQPKTLQATLPTPTPTQPQCKPQCSPSPPPRLTDQDVAAQRLQRALEVPLDRLGQVARVVRNPLALERDAAHLDAHRLEVHLVLHLADAARGGEQGLGGDAAPVDTGAADLVALDDGHLHALLWWGWGGGLSWFERRRGRCGALRCTARTRLSLPRPESQGSGAHLLHSVQRGAVAAHAAADDHQIVIVLAGAGVHLHARCAGDAAAAGDGGPVGRRL